MSDNEDFEIVDDNTFFFGAEDEINIIEENDDFGLDEKETNNKKKKKVKQNNSNDINLNNNNNNILKNKLSEIESIKNNLLKELKEIKNEKNEYQSLNNTIKKELSDIQSVKLSLEEERTKIKIARDKLKKDSNQLSNILNQMQLVPKYMEKNKEILSKLKTFYNQTNDFEKEIQKLQAIKNNININNNNTINNNNNNNNVSDLISLEKSKAFQCKYCCIDIALKEDIESKCYQVGQGQFNEKKRGYLFRTAVNLKLGAHKTENFTTGSYQISWVSCEKCGKEMGWKYISADNDTNQAKVGKFCLARHDLTSPEERNKK